MNLFPVSFSVAAYWQPVDDKLLTNSSSNGLVSHHAVFRLGGSAGESVVLTGWNYAGGYGSDSTTAKPAAVHTLMLSGNGTGSLTRSPILSGETTNGTGSVVVADFNRDGRDDLVLVGHNESPFIAVSSTAYLSNRAGSFDKIAINDSVLAHDAQVVNLSGTQTIVTRTFQPGDKDPSYVFGANGFNKIMGKKLSTDIPAGNSITVGTDNSGQQFLAVGDAYDPRYGLFNIQVYAVSNGDITGTPTVITPYLSSLPQYKNFKSFMGPGVSHSHRIWSDDFNHDGRADIVVGQSLFADGGAPYPSALQLLQSEGNLQFKDVTAKLNGQYPLDRDEIDYAMRMVDLDGSGIKSYLSAHGALPGASARQSNFLLVNDGTGKMHVALHSEFLALAEQVRSYVATLPEVRAQGLYVPPDLASSWTPAFIGVRGDNGNLNFVADLPLNRPLNGDPTSNVKVPVHVLVNVPLDLNITTAITDAFQVNDRNGSQLIRTFAGNDTISDVNAAPTAKIDGGLGIDVARYSGAKASYKVVQTTEGWKVTSEGAAIKVSDTLVNVERLQFADSVLALDISGNAGSAYRLYQAALNRTPDTAGLSWHVKQLDRGMSLREDAAGFLGSTEFKSRYGASLDDKGFVNALYQNVLGRAADANGEAYWINQIASGAQTRADALVGFSESAENHRLVDLKIAGGILLDFSIFG